MNNYEAAAFIEEKLPEAHVFENTGRLTFDINKTIASLADFLKKKFLVHDMVSVKKILRVTETIYIKGDKAVKSSVENILIFSFSSFMPQEKFQRHEFQAQIPATLFTIYVQQIMHSNI